MSARLFNRIKQEAGNWAQATVDLVMPEALLRGEAPRAIADPLCGRCGMPLAVEVVRMDGCPKCDDRTWHLQQIRAGYEYEGQVADAIHGFKYYDQFHLRKLLAEWLTAGFQRFYSHQDWTALVPVALAGRRQRERGFNQAQELGQGLSSKTNIPVWNCLHRTRDTAAQTHQPDREGRWRNMRGAFALNPRFDVQGARLLIIDDVLTTGATVNACARALQEAGAASICALGVARG